MGALAMIGGTQCMVREFLPWETCLLPAASVPTSLSAASSSMYGVAAPMRRKGLGRIIFRSLCRSQLGDVDMERGGRCNTFGRRSGNLTWGLPSPNFTTRSSIVCMAEPYMIAKLDSAERTYKELSVRLADPDVASNNTEYQKVARSLAELEEVVQTYQKFKECESQLEEAKEMAKEAAGDRDMAEMAAEEASMLAKEVTDLEEQLKVMLLPSDPLDSRNIMLEVRAGTGGDEAGIWAGDLVRMYQKFAERNSWRCSPISATEAEKGGYKELVLEITGERVYSKLKYEAGVHRVQRVPATESQGRVHTSTATVAIMPEVDEVEIVIDPKEIELSTARSGGAGGSKRKQGRNCSRPHPQAYRNSYFCTEERSQLKNKIRAFQLLRAKLYDIKLREQQESISSARKSQVGTGARSEKIRTYNYKDNRVSDHRTKINFDLMSILNGELEGPVQSCAAMEQKELLEELAASVNQSTV